MLSFEMSAPAGVPCGIALDAGAWSAWLGHPSLRLSGRHATALSAQDELAIELGARDEAAYALKRARGYRRASRPRSTGE